jgi:hypothetical protein
MKDSLLIIERKVTGFILGAVETSIKATIKAI